ncbi:MAG: TRAP transporter permease [Parasporobacterium sp.]|nr:TRAP transporter permease [Parasporobacterium sp.]
MKKYDRESNVRIWEGTPKYIVMGVLIAFSLFCIGVTLFATWLDQVRLTSFVGLGIIMGYLTYPAKKGVQKTNYMPWYDFVLMICGGFSYFYFCFNAKTIIPKLPSINTFEFILGIIGIITIMELCRRSVGIPILVVAGIFIIYALFYFGQKVGLGRGSITLVGKLFYSTTAVFGTPINVCSKYIVVFIIFGAFLEKSGISDFFIELANSVAGSASGGPAKVAVISSALCGMVSGSSVGNTVTTGSVTIPMMKRTGYKGEFAGAVEAAASTGGQIMPPIMGAAAFLMSEYVNVPYSNIIVRAILPAVLYFAGIFICVHLEAKKLGLKGLSKEELPIFKKLIKRSFLLLPLIILVYLVSSQTRTMAYSAAIAIVFAIAVSNMRKDPVLSIIGCVSLLVYLFIPMPVFLEYILLGVGIICCIICVLKKDADMNWKDILEALATGGRSCISIIAACCIAGVVAGCITMTGLASQIISAIVTVANIFPGGLQLFVALFLTMICCIVLGMGVPTTANYCIMATTCAPILIQMGVPTIAAHFFVFYFGIVADITPPVALAAYAGSAIAQSNPMKTALNASRLAIAAFIVPYIFAMNPTMLFVNVDSVFSVILIVITSILGIFGVSAALGGFFLTKMNPVERILAAIGGLVLIDPGIVTDIIGIVILAGVFIWQFVKKKKAKVAV